MGNLTDTVSLWLCNTSNSYHYWQRVVRELRASAYKAKQVKRGDWTEVQYTRYSFGERLRNYHEFHNPWNNSQVKASVYGELLTSAIGMVDWQEVADNLMPEELLDEEWEGS